MPPEITSITITQREVTARVHAKLMRESLRTAGQNHIENVLPQHFEPGADRRYGYAKRTKAYQIRKAKQVHHQIPLVLTGKLKDHVIRNSKVTATQHKATVYIKGYFPLVPERRRELEAMDARDRNAAQLAAMKHYRAEVTKPENQPKRKLRIT